MGGDQPELLRRPVEHRGRSLGDEAVTDAMESVTTNRVPGEPVLGHRVPKGVRGHGVMERSVEHGNLWQLGQGGAHRVDSGETGRVVQWRQLTERTQPGDDFVVDQHR
jgi:hypothetical protein